MHKLNLWLDLTLSAVFLVIMSPLLTGIPWHEWLAVGLSVVVSPTPLGVDDTRWGNLLQESISPLTAENYRGCNAVCGVHSGHA